MHLASRIQLAFFLGLSAAASAAFADETSTLTFIPGSSVKLYQVNGDCDWVEWDATIDKSQPDCKQTRSQTATRADVLGDDVPVVFEHGDKMIVTFGDTFGADETRYPKWVKFQKQFKWDAHDPIAQSDTRKASDKLLLDFFMEGGHALLVRPTNQPDGKEVKMGADDVPSAGLSLDSQIYLAVTTGSEREGTGKNIDRSKDYSVLVKFDEKTQKFESGRTISKPPDGRFVRPIFVLGQEGSPRPDPEPVEAPVVWIFGVAQSSPGVFLSSVPAAQFWSGADEHGKSATRYFKGLEAGRPTWSGDEAEAKPIVIPPKDMKADVPYATVSYTKELGLWVMIFDVAGKGSDSGMYMTYARDPWGAWSEPQLIFNSCRDHGFGNFMFYYYDAQEPNDCPAAMSHGAAKMMGNAGPAGPTAGNQEKNVPEKTRGIAYGPAIVGRFTTIDGDRLKLFYMMSTWNPYAVVMMESDFTIGCKQIDPILKAGDENGAGPKRDAERVTEHCLPHLGGGPPQPKPVPSRQPIERQPPGGGGPKKLY